MEKQVFFTVMIFILQEIIITLGGSSSEISVNFNMPSNYSTGDVDAESVVKNILGTEKMHVTVVLTKMADSMKSCVMS